MLNVVRLVAARSFSVNAPPLIVTVPSAPTGTFTPKLPPLMLILLSTSSGLAMLRTPAVMFALVRPVAAVSVRLKVPPFTVTEPIVA